MAIIRHQSLVISHFAARTVPQSFHSIDSGSSRWSLTKFLGFGARENAGRRAD